MPAHDYGIKVMGDNLGADDRIANAQWLEMLGVDYVIHHIGYDERRLIKGLSPMDELDDVVRGSVRPRAGSGRPHHPAGDRMSRARRAAGRPRGAAGHRRRRLQARRLDLHDVLSEICGEIRKTPFKRPRSWSQAR